MSDYVYDRPWLLGIIGVILTFAFLPTMVFVVWAVGWSIRLTIDTLNIIGWPAL